MASSTAVGGGNISPTNELSPDAWFGHSSFYKTGDDNASAPFQHLLHEVDRPQPECSAMVLGIATPKVDLQSDTEAPSRPSSDVASAVVAIAPSVVTTAGLGVVDDTEPHVHDRENKGDDTSEGSKKKREVVFLGGVKLVDLDDCNILDMRLQCDNEDTDDNKAPNQEDMDVDIDAPSCVQIVGPSSSTTAARVSIAIPVQTDPLV